MNWDGEFGGDFICVDESNEHHWILEELKLKAAINKDAPKITGEIQRFSPIISLRYKKDGQDNTKPVTIKIDFALYELISDMKAGYRPTMQDKNRHTDFVSFVQQALMLSTKQYCGISNGSACNSKSYEPSYVLTAMGIPTEKIENTVRISWGQNPTVRML